MSNSNSLSRRAATQLLFGAAVTLSAPHVARAQTNPRLLIIGGGFGGASAARYARLNHPTLNVTMIEPKSSFVTCP